MTVVAWHEDRGVSGGAPLEDRPGLTAALADLAAQGAGVLVVARRDRLARDVLNAALIERLKDFESRAKTIEYLQWLASA